MNKKYQNCDYREELETFLAQLSDSNFIIVDRIITSGEKEIGAHFAYPLNEDKELIRNDSKSYPYTIIRIYAGKNKYSWKFWMVNKRVLSPEERCFQTDIDFDAGLNLLSDKSKACICFHLDTYDSKE